MARFEAMEAQNLPCKWGKSTLQMGKIYPANGENLPCKWGSPFFNPFKRIGLQRRFSAYILNTLSILNAQALRFGFGQGFKSTTATIPTAPAVIPDQAPDLFQTLTADAGFETRPVLTGGKQALCPVREHSGH